MTNPTRPLLYSGDAFAQYHEVWDGLLRSLSAEVGIMSVRRPASVIDRFDEVITRGTRVSQMYDSVHVMQKAWPSLAPVIGREVIQLEKLLDGLGYHYDLYKKFAVADPRYKSYYQYTAQLDAALGELRAAHSGFVSFVRTTHEGHFERQAGVMTEGAAAAGGVKRPGVRTGWEIAFGILAGIAVSIAMLSIIVYHSSPDD